MFVAGVTESQTIGLALWLGQDVAPGVGVEAFADPGLGAGPLLVLSLFFTWQNVKVDYGPAGVADLPQDGWDAWGLLIAVLALTAVTLVVLRRLTEVEMSEDVPWESIVLALRRSRGLKRARLDRWAGAPVPEWTQWAAGAGALRLDPPGRIRPTTRGLLVAHEISAELLARMGPETPPRAVP